MANPFEVGFGKPPRSTRFKPGQSGNRKGRPKGSKSLKTLLSEALSRHATIYEDGVPKRTEYRELFFASLVTRAIKGDARATALLVRLIGQLGLSKPDGEDGSGLVVVISKEDARLL